MLWQPSRRRDGSGFTVIELVVLVLVISILAMILGVRLRDTRAEAKVASDQASVAEMQKAYEKAKVQRPEMLTNESIVGLGTNLLTVGLVSKVAPNIAAIRLATNTSIVGLNALFLTNGDPHADPFAGTGTEPSIALISPTDGSQVSLGRAIQIVTAANGAFAKVEFFVNGSLYQTVQEQPFTVEWTPEMPTNYTLFVKAYGVLNRIAISGTAHVSGFQNYPPAVVLTGSSGNQLVSTPLSFIINASDPNTGDIVTKVELMANSTLIHTFAAPPYEFIWNDVRSGHYAMVARAYDAFDAYGESGSLDIHVQENEPLTVHLNPVSSVRLYYPDTVSFAVTTGDSEGVITNVALYVSGQLVGTRDAAPYDFAWNAVPGNHVVTAKAYNRYGASGEAAGEVSVANNRRPAVSIISPGNDASVVVGETVPITVHATDPDDNLAKVEVFIDGEVIGSSNEGPDFAFVWNVSGGLHILQAIAYDVVGATKSAQINISGNPHP